MSVIIIISRVVRARWKRPAEMSDVRCATTAIVVWENTRGDGGGLTL
jgi:hypothetical protein